MTANVGRGLDIGFGQRSIVDDMEGGIEEQQETRATGVDHPRVGQHLQQGRGAGQRRHSLRCGPRRGPPTRSAPLVGGGDGGLARFAHHGEDRALDRVADGAVRPLGRRGQGPGEPGAVDPGRASAATPENPRRICDMITPLLPRAPMSEPWAIALQIDAMSVSAPSSSSTTDRSVSDMLVPVSPSGTGYTLRLFTASRWSTRASRNTVTSWRTSGGIERRSRTRRPIVQGPRRRRDLRRTTLCADGGDPCRV